MKLSYIPAVLLTGTVLFNTAVPVSAANITQPVPAVQVHVNQNDRTIDQPEGLKEFAGILKGGNPERVAGLFAPGVGRYYIVQQAPGQNSRVSPVAGVLTQFMMPASGGVIGLLGHNYAAGKRFTLFKPGDHVYLVYGDGSVQPYRLMEFQQYQAVDPDDPGSRLINLASGKFFSAAEVYQQIYTGAPRLVLQTCLTRDDNLKWGRLFILAEKIQQDY